jgi:hypothetical protein
MSTFEQREVITAAADEKPEGFDLLAIMMAAGVYRGVTGAVSEASRNVTGTMLIDEVMADVHVIPVGEQVDEQLTA